MDAGATTRLRFLRETAQHKFLEPLTTHGWTASIVYEAVVDDGYLLIEAERGGATHRVALLYSSATRSEVYRQLAAEAEHIYINAQRGWLEPFAYGVSTPVSRADDFFDLLVKWNTETQFAVGAQRPAKPITPVVDEHRVIQSDDPIEGIWIRLRQLQSVTLARKAVQRRFARAQLDGSAAGTKAVRAAAASASPRM